jgi:hypothetical protein
VTRADTTGRRDTERVERVGLVGVYAMLATHLLWDPTLTAVGVAEFGIAEEDNDLVRRLWRLHPSVWLVAKGLVVGGAAGVVVRIGAHRDPATAWFPYLMAAVGFVAPLGWLELLLTR